MKKLNNYSNYFDLNKYVSNLKKIKVKIKNKRNIFQNRDSIIILVFYKVYIFFRTLSKYLLELFIGGKYLIWIFFAKKIKKNDYCIIFGNGPSLDLMKIKELKKISLFFDIFVVNNFTQNKFFDKIIPNFFVSSDPIIFTKKNNLWSKKAENKLRLYIKKNPNISIFTPVLQCKKYKRIFEENKILGFIDSDARILSNNILPIFPRGYISSTTMKAICIANWIGYKKIFLLGVDNTYFRNFFLNKKNQILTLENYSNTRDFVYDQSSYYSCLSKAMLDQYELFKDLKKINKKNNIYNLDQYSVTGFDKTYNIKSLLKKLLLKKIL